MDVNANCTRRHSEELHNPLGGESLNDYKLEVVILEARTAPAGWSIGGQ